MPSTLLDPRTGKPELDYPIGSVSKANAALTSPNRLARRVLDPKANEILWNFRDGGSRPTMAGLRSLTKRQLHEYMTLGIMGGSGSHQSC